MVESAQPVGSASEAGTGGFDHLKGNATPVFPNLRWLFQAQILEIAVEYPKIIHNSHGDVSPLQVFSTHRMTHLRGLFNYLLN